MLDTSREPTVILRLRRREDDKLSDPEALKNRCLDPAQLWVLKRRAHLPYQAPQRLPAVARLA